MLGAFTRPLSHKVAAPTSTGYTAWFRGSVPGTQPPAFVPPRPVGLSDPGLSAIGVVGVAPVPLSTGNPRTAGRRHVGAPHRQSWLPY